MVRRDVRPLMIILVGTGHVFDLASALNTLLDEKQPDVICVELDQQRYRSLINKRTNPEPTKTPPTDLPFIYRLFARFQQSMAQQYGVNAGDEMLTAAEYAQTHQLPLDLIDMNAQQLFIKMWRTMPIREKIRLVFSGFIGFFVSKKQVESELKNFQDNFEDYLEKIGVQFPTIKHVLIDQRNEYMVKRLIELTENHKRIIACLGDGHLPGIAKLLEADNQEYEVIRLDELRKISPKPSDGSEAHFSISYSPPEN
jgi:pheromone shutdown protein TraB